MKNFFELPIHIEDVESVTNCWIFNRLAIIKTSPYYKDWIASHYNLYVNNEYNFYFGDVSMYPPAYHDEILQRKPIRILEFSPENIIEKLKEYLKNEYYIIMHIKPHKDYDYFHESLFYGFDDEKESFMIVGLQNRIFRTVMFPYSYLKDTIKQIQNYFLCNEKLGIIFAENYQCPATALKLNSSFKPDNCVFEAYSKLKRELNGEWHEVHGLSGFADYKPASCIYRGISCLDAFKQVLEKEIKSEEFVSKFKGISSAAKKLLEHRRMLNCSMDYILENWKDAMTNHARTSAAEYNKCNLIVEKWLYLCLKYEHTKDKALLKKIALEVPQVFSKEKTCLERFINDGIDWHKFNENYI